MNRLNWRDELSELEYRIVTHDIKVGIKDYSGLEMNGGPNTMEGGWGTLSGTVNLNFKAGTEKLHRTRDYTYH